MTAYPSTKRTRLIHAADTSCKALPEGSQPMDSCCSLSKPEPAWETRPQAVYFSKAEDTARKIAASLDYMMKHLNQPIRISVLSTMAGWSESRYFELFKGATGYTPLNWFIRARMNRASEQLEQTNLQIKEIANQAGYGDPLYFSRLFKSVAGISPSAYRSKKQKEAAASDGAPRILTAPFVSNEDDYALKHGN